MLRFMAACCVSSMLHFMALGSCRFATRVTRTHAVASVPAFPVTGGRSLVRRVHGLVTVL
jgi:hypothetical protein